MSRVKNLMVGTDPTGHGGIATVMNVYKTSGLLAQFDFKSISTHSALNQSILSAGFLYLKSLLQVSCYGVFFKLGVVHVHMASRGSFLRKSLIVRLVKLFGGKVILHLHGGGFRDFYSIECSERKQKNIRRVFEMSDSVIVLSTQWLAWMREILTRSDHVGVVYNAVPALELDRSFVQRGLVVFLGRIEQRKGVEDLIRAFTEVVKTCPDAKLALGGDGEIEKYKALVQELGISHAVDFLGWVSGKDKEDLLARADIYCLPSYYEGFPMGILEAMSARVPVVSSRAGGIPDAITHQQDGLLIDAGDFKDLAESLELLITDRDLNAKLAVTALAKYQCCFSTQVIIPQLDQLYGELLGTEVGR